MIDQVKIKITGKKEALQKVLKKIKSLYPIVAEGDVLPNDNDGGCHVFITVPEEVGA